MMRFYGLHQHSCYSVLDGLSTVDSLIEYAKDNKLDSIALTEHGTLSSAYELWDKCNKNGIKPILGLEGYFVDDVNSNEGLLPYSYSHIVLLSQNEVGWKNLKKIHWMSCKAMLKKPRIDYAMLKGNVEGLVCSTACTGGLIGSIVNKNKYYDLLSEEERTQALNDRIKRFKALFPGRFYLEMMLNDLPEQKVVNKKVLRLAKSHSLPTIITNDSHYTYEEDNALHDVIRCVLFKSQLNQQDNGTYDIHNLYNIGYEDLKAVRRSKHKYIPFDVFKQSVSNARKIVSNVENYAIRVKASALPRFADDSSEVLKKLCEGDRKKSMGKSWNETYQKRLDRELEVIFELGMADYFLIVWDIAREARERDIPFNTRGSVGGSLVAYLIGISWIDPIKFDTTFERFLTEDRLSLPDIDMDFGKQRRGEMIEYLRSKYGDGSIAHIVNFTKFKPRGAIKDVARVHGLSFGAVNKVTGLIPDGTDSWDDIPDIAEVNEFFDNNSEVIEDAQHLTGVIRHRGVHASGVVLTPGNIIDWVPIAWATVDGETGTSDKVTEFDMYALEDMNILKLDFLGQNTLDILKYTLEIIGSEIKTFDQLMSHVLNNLDDKEVYKYIRSGELIGTFQMGTSEGMRTLIKQVKPKNIFDIVDCVALYRSAVLAVGAHTRYVNRKFGREAVTYLHPKMESVLDKSKGILLFQESTMALAVHLAGFTPTESDHFRKGIKQKDKEKFNKWEVKFVEGCKKYSGIEKSVAEKIWHEIEVWSGYGFCLCIEENQLVSTVNGSKKIKDITEDDIVMTYSVEDDTFYYDKVVKQYETGIQEVYEIELESGEKIQATMKHRFLCHDGEYRTLKTILSNGYKIGKINSCMS